MDTDVWTTNSFKLFKTISLNPEVEHGQRKHILNVNVMFLQKFSWAGSVRASLVLSDAWNKRNKQCA